MERKTRFILFLGIICLLASCSPVRIAIYDSKERHDYAIESKTAFEKSPVVQEKLARVALAEEARKYIGTPYKYGSCDASRGFDCSGLVYTVAKAQDLELPRSSGLMAASGTHIPWKKAEEGDLIFFGDHNKIHHVGIVEKNNGHQLWVIHSTTSDGVVKQNVLANAYWKKRILFAVDIFPVKT